MSSRRSLGFVGGAMIVAVGAMAWFIGCSVNVGSGGVSSSLTIGNTTVTIGLGQAGLFIVTSNTRVRNVADLAPFERPPGDIPTYGAVYLRSSSVTVLPAATGGGKIGPNQQGGISGTAHLRVALDAKGAASPCDTGTDLGTFEITVTDGVATSVSPGLYLALSSVGYFVHNAMSLCLEMEADFGATIRIQGLDVIFGPSASPSPDTLSTGTFELRNTDSAIVHIASPGEDFVDSNRLAGGSSRTVGIGGFRYLSLVTFRAGRNDQILASVTCPPIDVLSYQAIVVWDGSQLRCSLPGSTEGAPEACCVPPITGYESNPPPHNQFVQACVDIGTRFAIRNRDNCVTYPGVRQGSGTTCADTVCEAAFQACCFGEHSGCGEMLCDQCVAFDGHPQGEGVHCESLPCANPRLTSSCGNEACCFESGSCDPLAPEDCGVAGGVPKGPGTDCSPNLCPQPTQPKATCCASDGSCTLSTQAACTAPGSTYNSSFSTCTPNPCLQPPEPTGACCVTGTCNDLTAAECAALPGGGGAYSGDGISCATVECAQPGGPFAITGVNAPRTCGGCPGQDLIVTWSGDPVFPVTLKYQVQAGECPVNVDCIPATTQFAQESNPLVFDGVIFCTGSFETRIVGFEVVMRDARGIEAAPFPAPLICDPAP